MKPYKAKSLKGAERMVNNLRHRVKECHELLARFDREQRLLALLASEKPEFYNPLKVVEAKQIRDRILSLMRV